MTVAMESRHTKQNPCPICDGHRGDKHGKGVRCWGFDRLDEKGRKWTYCTREEFAGSLEMDSGSQTYRHLMNGSCRCGVTHGAPLELVDAGSFTRSRSVAAISRELGALELLADSATTEEQYEADRQRRDELWAELERAKTGEKPRAPIEWVGIAKFAEPLPPVDWLCEDLKLAKGPCTCFAGYGYSGKTAILQYLLLCIVAGKAPFGLFKAPTVPVGWMDYEQGFRQSAGRLQRQARGLGVNLSDIPHGLWRYAEYPDVYLTDRDTKATDAIARAVDGLGLCLLDSARALTPGVDENDSKIRIPFDALSRVTRQTGCQFVLVHHYGKSDPKAVKPLKERMRGSSALFDAMATVWGLERRDREDFTRLSLAKDRWTNQENISFGVRFEDGVDLAGAEYVKLHHLEPEQMRGLRPIDAAKERILAVAKAEPGLSANGIFARVGGNRAVVLEAVKEMKKDGSLRLDMEGGYRAP